MLRTILLELFLPFRPFRKTANIGRTTISPKTFSESFSGFSVYNQPRTQASSRHLSYQRRLGTKSESEFSRQASQVTSQPKIAKDDWERGCKTMSQKSSQNKRKTWLDSPVYRRSPSLRKSFSSRPLVNGNEDAGYEDELGIDMGSWHRPKSESSISQRRLTK